MRVAVAALTGVLLAALPAQAQSVEEFYKGKTINLAIGFSVGGGYDLYARHLARHIGKHIPGNPTILPQNMAGAGSLRAANFIYTAAPKDGTAFGTFARTTGINPLLESGASSAAIAARHPRMGKISGGGKDSSLANGSELPWRHSPDATGKPVRSHVCRNRSPGRSQH